MTTTTYDMFIGGAWVPAASGAVFDSMNPYSEKAWATVPSADATDVDRAVRAAREALDGPWGAMTGFDRARLMRRLAAVVERDAADLAIIESTDNGKLLRESSA